MINTILMDQYINKLTIDGINNDGIINLIESIPTRKEAVQSGFRGYFILPINKKYEELNDIEKLVYKLSWSNINKVLNTDHKDYVVEYFFKTNNHEKVALHKDTDEHSSMNYKNTIFPKCSGVLYLNDTNNPLCVTNTMNHTLCSIQKNTSVNILNVKKNDCIFFNGKFLHGGIPLNKTYNQRYILVMNVFKNHIPDIPSINYIDKYIVSSINYIDNLKINKISYNVNNIIKYKKLNLFLSDEIKNQKYDNLINLIVKFRSEFGENNDFNIINDLSYDKDYNYNDVSDIIEYYNIEIESETDISNNYNKIKNTINTISNNNYSIDFSFYSLNNVEKLLYTLNNYNSIFNLKSLTIISDFDGYIISINTQKVENYKYKLVNNFENITYSKLKKGDHLLFKKNMLHYLFYDKKKYNNSIIPTFILSNYNFVNSNIVYNDENLYNYQSVSVITINNNYIFRNDYLNDLVYDKDPSIFLDYINKFNIGDYTSIIIKNIKNKKQSIEVFSKTLENHFYTNKQNNLLFPIREKNFIGKNVCQLIFNSVSNVIYNESNININSNMDTIKLKSIMINNNEFNNYNFIINQIKEKIKENYSFKNDIDVNIEHIYISEYNEHNQFYENIKHAFNVIILLKKIENSDIDIKFKNNMTIKFNIGDMMIIPKYYSWKFCFDYNKLFFLSLPISFSF
jgi:hypothetical protein